VANGGLQPAYFAAVQSLRNSFPSLGYPPAVVARICRRWLLRVVCYTWYSAILPYRGCWKLLTSMGCLCKVRRRGTLPRGDKSQ
jgi:hypothetical protein